MTCKRSSSPSTQADLVNRFDECRSHIKPYLNRLRDQEKARQGASFDIKAFHDKVLKSGAMPLDVLERMFA